MHRSRSWSATLCASALLWACATLWPAPSRAAEFTDLLDAADDFDDLDPNTWDPFDFNLEAAFSYRNTSAQIAREAPCVPGGDPLTPNNPRLETSDTRCREARIINNREMIYNSTRSQIDIQARVGLFKDLELHLNVPYVFVNTRSLRYDNSDPLRSVDSRNSSVDPAPTCDNNEPGRCIEREIGQTFSPTDTDSQRIEKLDQFSGYQLFSLDEQREYLRSGFSEPSVGLHWSVFNDQRDDTKANLLLGLDYVMPIVPIARADNRAIGRGVHELQFKIASSKRFDWVEPYFGVQYFLPFAATDSPIREVDPQNQGQVFKNPPMRGEFTLGAEFVPHENRQTGSRVGIDLRFDFGYTSEGRDYTALYDHMVNSRCNRKTLRQVLPTYQNGELQNAEDVACAWIVRQPSNARAAVPAYDLNELIQDGRIETLEFATDGIMTVEAHGMFRGMAGIYVQPSKYFQLKANVGLEHQQEHFITNARTGRDVADSLEQTADTTVDLTGPDARLERNPVHNPTIDGSGERFRIQAMNTWVVSITAALQF